MVLVLLEVVGIDGNVVQISSCEVVQVRCQGVIKEILECCGCVGESEGHYQRFEQAVPHSERRLPLVAIFHPNEVVGSVYIQFGEDLSLS